ncbi:kinase-like domain-containing protein [Syncephalis fuscata]|nr:kinase-like domain-containing protein [Syncephalis fuscata]
MITISGVKFTAIVAVGILCATLIPFSSGAQVAQSQAAHKHLSLDALKAAFLAKGIKFNGWISTPRSVKIANVQYNGKDAFLKCPTRLGSILREERAFKHIEKAQPDNYGVGNNIVRRLGVFKNADLDCFILSHGGTVTLESYAHSKEVNHDGDTLAPLIGQLLKAVRFLHDHAGIVHGDIKPDNILVRLTSPPQITLIDFDLSYVKGERFKETQLTEYREYMAPELLSGTANDREDRHDVWALGITIFHLLTTEPTIGKATELDRIQAIVRKNQFKRLSSMDKLKSTASLGNVNPFSRAVRDITRQMILCLTYKYQDRPSLSEIIGEEKK